MRDIRTLYEDTETPGTTETSGTTETNQEEDINNG